MLIYELTDAANSPYALLLNVSDLLGSNHREATKIRHFGGARLSRGHIIRWKLPNCNLVVRSLRCYMSIVYPESQKKLCHFYACDIFGSCHSPLLPDTERVDCANILGVHFSDTLSPAQHIYHLISQCNQRLFLLLSHLKHQSLSVEAMTSFSGSHALQDNIGLRHSSLCWTYLSHRYKQN